MMVVKINLKQIHLNTQILLHTLFSLHINAGQFVYMHLHILNANGFLCINGQKQLIITMETVQDTEGSAAEQSVFTLTSTCNSEANNRLLQTGDCVYRSIHIVKTKVHIADKLDCVMNPQRIRTTEHSLSNHVHMYTKDVDT